MFSELVIASTLIVNAFAILNFKLTPTALPFNSFTVDDASRSVGDKIREFLLSLQYFRVFIGLWNIFIIFLMIVFFSH
ncbi:hypothetical protein AB6A40_009970 [Gnathostoma spinigerum]|uniref:Uncharacterized protein n=1 Tax=Gnathostoma spinigerum TaxID=75299 RepID=A0ABD6F078_9BILA